MKIQPTTDNFIAVTLEGNRSGYVNQGSRLRFSLMVEIDKGDLQDLLKLVNPADSLADLMMRIFKSEIDIYRRQLIEAISEEIY